MGNSYKKFRKNDVYLIGILIVIGIAGLLLMQAGKKQGGTVVVKVDGKVYKEFNLSENQTVEIVNGKGNKNILEVKDGKVNMTYADCNNQVCVNHKKIMYNGETIICMPNDVIVEIHSDDDSNVDAVAR